MPKDLAVANPTVADIEQSLKTSKIPFKIETNSHPSFWWRREGRFVVEYVGKKNELIKKIAKKIKVTVRK